MGNLVAEAELRARLADGGRLEAVLVVARRDCAGGVQYIPYLRPNWSRRYLGIGLWRGPGLRVWRDFTRLHGFIRDDLGYALPLAIHREDCPKLARLRSFPHPYQGDEASSRGTSPRS